jgi:hypothetical protein
VAGLPLVILVMGNYEKKPFIRFAHLLAFFSLMLMKINFQRNGKIKPGTFVTGFFLRRGGRITRSLIQSIHYNLKKQVNTL